MAREVRNTSLGTPWNAQLSKETTIDKGKDRRQGTMCAAGEKGQRILEAKGLQAAYASLTQADKHNHGRRRN